MLNSVITFAQSMDGCEIVFVVTYSDDEISSNSNHQLNRKITNKKTKFISLVSLNIADLEVKLK